MVYIVRITICKCLPNEHGQRRPSETCMVEGESHTFSYKREGFHYIEGPIQLLEEDLYSSAGVRIIQGVGTDPQSVFLIRELEGCPTDPRINPRCSWMMLGFDELCCTRCTNSGGAGHEGTPCQMQCSFVHAPGLNRVEASLRTNPCLQLISKTDHFSNTDDLSNTDSAQYFLSGKLAIFWGVAALTVGNRGIQNLEHYFSVGSNHQLGLEWPTNLHPDRTLDRAVAVRIYRDFAGDDIEVVEAAWRLVNSITPPSYKRKATSSTSGC